MERLDAQNGGYFLACISLVFIFIFLVLEFVKLGIG